MDAPRDAYAVVWLEQERTQDQKVERPLQQISLWRNATLLQIFCMRVLDYLQNVNRKATASWIMWSVAIGVTSACQAALC